MQDYLRLVSLLRGQSTEVRVDGEIVVHDGKQVLFQSSDYLGEYPMRSLLKPFQLLATGLKLGGEDSLRRVPSLGSISATVEQVKQLQNWYSDPKYKKLISALKFAPQYPWDEENRVLAKKSVDNPSPFFHMCFSKHMAILSACQEKGWDLETYDQAKHPYQKSLVKVLGAFLERDCSNIKMVIDGCKLPTPVLTLAEMAKLYQKIASAQKGTEIEKIRQMMVSFPGWIGGPTRVDTMLMQKNKGLVAKEGADGLLGLAVPPSAQYPQGLGIVIKIFSGFQPKLAALALSPLLESLGLHSIAEFSSGHSLEYHYRPFERNSVKFWDISPEISEDIAVWPGDQKYERYVSLDTRRGDHLTLSRIQTTLHLGAHTDAINHTENTQAGIDSHSFDLYYGSCQVIEVSKNRGELILKSDLHDKKIRARRILFKTSSFPDPKHFNDDFVALSQELVQFLAESGVVLVGIDTPSIDPFSSKELPAHHAVFKATMGILEGIVLRDVDEGIYHLSAVPLKLKGADASPVRAFLKEI